MARKLLVLVIIVGLMSAVLPGVAPAQGVPPIDGMISYWAFDEGSGAIAGDSAGANDGIIHGATWTTGQVNGALSFDGDDYVSVGDIGLDTSEFSISLWYKTNDWGTSGVSSGTLIANNYSYWGSRGWVFWLYSDQTWFSVNHNASLTVAGYADYKDKWTHTVFTKDAAGQGRIYFDGVEAASYIYDTPWTNPYFPSGENVEIGRRADEGRSWYFKGLIDELAVYNRVLTAEEIEGHYENGLQGLGYANPVNDGPVADNDTATVDEGGTVEVDVLNNDTDDDSTLSYGNVTITTAPTNGTATVGPSGITYTHDGSETASDSFVYEICDAGTPNLCDTATVTITINPVNDAPVANDDSAETDEDFPVTIDVLGNDTDVDSVGLSVASVTQGSNGSVSINGDNTVSYTPNDNFNGTDTFAYTASDGTDVSAPATVTVTVNMAGRLKGTVRRTDGSTPIGGVTVTVYDPSDAQLSAPLGQDVTDGNGEFAITVALSKSPESFHVLASYTGSYVDEWYEEGRTWDAATTVRARHGEDEPGIDFTLSELLETPPGEDVVIEDPDADLTIQFGNVTEPGETSVDVSDRNPGGATADFKLQGQYFDIVTTASLDPESPITVTFTYDDTGMSLKKQKRLRLLHWTGDNWEDATQQPVDTDNNKITGIVYNLSWFALSELNDPPVSDAGGPYCIELGNSVVLVGAGSDPDGDPIEFAWDLDSDGVFETVGESATFQADSTGLHAVALAVTDETGARAVDTTLVVVYDPSAGFATGGGRLIPAGATSDDGDALPNIDGTSPASFGFVVKYKQGASTPDGQLEFQYRQGDFNLHSSGLEWLVIVNNNWAKFHGSATIKGLDGVFPFQVDARDGDFGGGDRADRFVIKVYAPGADPDASDPIYKASGDLTGGNIMIHAKK